MIIPSGSGMRKPAGISEPSQSIRLLLRSYRLAAPADVSIAIYAADGKLVRTLALGHQEVGIYQSKSHAAYWDGRNAQGESVASGVYFYTLTAGDFTATRKLLIRK